MTTAIALTDTTIHPVIEQQGGFFKVLDFFPSLSKELLDENRSWLEPAMARRLALAETTKSRLFIEFSGNSEIWLVMLDLGL